MQDQPFSDEDYQALSAFRTGLRRFVRFSETAARDAGLTPQQHQVLVAVRGHVGAEPPTVGDLSEALQIKHHSAVELVDRVALRGLVERRHSEIDNRRVYVVITPDGEELLRSLTVAHRSEIRQLEGVFRQLISRFEASQK